MLLFCSCSVPDTGFLLCFPWLISLVQKIMILPKGRKAFVTQSHTRYSKLKSAFEMEAGQTLWTSLCVLTRPVRNS